jgi:hypothetical protein
MMFFRDFLQFRYVYQPREFVEMKHVLVFTVLTEKSHILAEIHVLEVICDKAAIAALNALAEYRNYFFIIFHDWIE